MQWPRKGRGRRGNGKGKAKYVHSTQIFRPLRCASQLSDFTQLFPSVKFLRQHFDRTLRRAAVDSKKVSCRTCSTQKRLWSFVARGLNKTGEWKGTGSWSSRSPVFSRSSWPLLHRTLLWFGELRLRSGLRSVASVLTQLFLPLAGEKHVVLRLSSWPCR